MSISTVRNPVIAAWIVMCALGSCTQTHVVLQPLTDTVPAADASTDDAGGAGGAGGAAVPPAVATAVSIAFYHACAIAGGALYCWGANDEGRLGLGDTNARLSPARVGIDADWVAVAVNEHSTLALKRNGTMWSFGGNDAGQLGHGDFSASQVPGRVGDRSDWTAITTRFDHACALARDGSLWCWGQNAEGQLGQDEVNTSSTDRPMPTQVTTDHDFAAVDAGQGHTCALRTNGTLWCWGRNSESELGQGSSTPLQVHHPVQVGTATDWQLVQGGQSSTCGVRGGVVFCWGRVIDQSLPGSAAGTVVSLPTTIGGPEGTVGMSFNTFGGCLFDAQGAAACWGRNAEGQLGVGDMNDRTDLQPLSPKGWTQVSAGRFSNCGIRSGRVVCAGDNRNGQLGQGDLNRTAVFVEVPVSP